MSELSKEYLILFSAITQAEQELQLLQERLIAAQQRAEEMYLQKDDPAQS